MGKINHLYSIKILQNVVDNIRKKSNDLKKKMAKVMQLNYLLKRRSLSAKNTSSK